MTDNRTTELLREGLTEHGTEWRSGLKGVTFVGDWCFVEYDNGKLAATCEPVLTPEQAIAATLGSDTKGCENLLWELVGALDVADATDASKKPIVKEYARRIAATLGSDEPPYDELLRCLENDWHISASWDGLRKFWCIELTEEGVKLRDATHGTLTAEQVSEAVLENFEETHETRYDHWEPSKFDWQAIADELNAELGNQFTGCGKKVER